MREVIGMQKTGGGFNHACETKYISGNISTARLFLMYVPLEIKHAL